MPKKSVNKRENKTFIHRVGNKQAIAAEIVSHFPKRISMYVEPFCGLLSIFDEVRNKYEDCQYFILNDADSNIHTLFNDIIIKGRDAELQKNIENILVSSENLENLRQNKNVYSFDDAMFKAIRFIFMQTYTLRSGAGSIRFSIGNEKKNLLEKFEKWLPYWREALKFAKFQNKMCHEFLSAMTFRSDAERNRTFIYCDPPYINTYNSYLRDENGSEIKKSWDETDLDKMLSKLCEMRVQFAVSEFKNEKTVALAEKHGLLVSDILERRNVTNDHQIEILIHSNYDRYE